jgi:Fe-S cluster biogenesis protein NfuA
MTTQTSSNDVLIRVQPTPNPNAWKFVLDRPVLLDGKATFSNADEAYGNRLALDLLALDGVKQVHFFQNVITITARFDADPDQIQREVCSVIQTRLPVHNPALGVQESRAAKRAELPPEIQKIEEILDRTVRPGLQGDGGDLEVVKYEDNKLYVNYQGACGTCPSATTGTLMAIESILRDEFNPQIEVIPI